MYNNKKKYICMKGSNYGGIDEQTFLFDIKVAEFN